MAGGGLVAREFYRPSESGSTSASALPATGALSPDQEPGPPTVWLTPEATAHPQHEVVRALMQTYFDAIDKGDYDSWRTTVTRAKMLAQPRPEWESNYRTTRDGSILVYRLDPLPNAGIAVLIGFTSVQDPSAAPPDVPAGCLRWRLVFPLTLESGHWKLDLGTSPDTLDVSRC